MPQTQNQQVPKSKTQDGLKKQAPGQKSKKKGGAVGIFISLICLAIVIVCLTPIFMGSSDDPEEVAVPASLDGNQSAASSSSQSLTGADIVIDDGALQKPIPEGLDAATPEATTSKQVVISGEELDEIEQNFKKPAASPSALAAAGDQSAADEKAAAGAEAEPVSARPAESLDAVSPSAPLGRASSAVRERLKVEESHKAEQSSQHVETAKADPVPAKTQAAVHKTEERVAAARGAGSSSVVSPDNVPFSGEAIPGGTSELAYKNQAHFTVQVVAGSNKANIIEVSAVLKGRYWIYETRHENRPWYVLITGEYPSREAASDAASLLPVYVKGAKPFPKSFATVRDEISNIN